MTLFDAIAFIAEFKKTTPGADKSAVQRAYIERFSPQKARSVFVSDGYALRFSEARTGSFSNTVLSLSALQGLDERPFVVAVVREKSVDFLMANTTFLKKISHSSHQLRIDNIKGSFNGTDIKTELNGVPNSPEYFDQLFAVHRSFGWEENLERLVDATNTIVGRDNRFLPTDAEKALILAAPERAQAALASADFRVVSDDLRRTVQLRREAILEVARLDNVNLRGNAIEQMLTGGTNTHNLGDFTRDIQGSPLVIDVKTKLLNRSSAPKAYNIDKMLAFLSRPGSVFAFLLVGVDTRTGEVTSQLLPVLEASLLECTVVQHHWSGRSSRGVTQLSGAYHRGSDPSYRPTVDVAQARAFLMKLLAL